VEKHGGRVWCQSQVGKGSTFGMSLPVVRPEKVE
jgi:signal transduction histidine kinase